MASPKTDRSERYTYADYLTWDGDERWELIDGVPYLMSSPSSGHQEVSAELEFALQTHLRGSDCRMYHAPMDLRFEADNDTEKVVQPDIFVMCGEYVRDSSIIGVPVLVIEILSPSTAKHDLLRKRNLYERVGVKEYWIVDTADQSVNVLLHDGERLLWTAEFKPGDTLSPSMFPDLLINVTSLFE